MKNQLFALGLAGALAVAGCSSNDSPSPDAGAPDGGEGGAAPDGGPPDGGHPPHDAKHELTTRTLLGTSAENLILDPLVTTDASLEHFIGLVLFAGGSGYDGYRAPREIRSQSPAGVALPVAVIGIPGLVRGGAERLQILAPIPGSSSPLQASVWVSAGDKDKAPASFADASHDLVVALLPNDAPTKSYPLALTGKPVQVGGRSWVKLALPAAVSMTEGGWISFATTSGKWTYEVQAPEVVRSADKANDKNAPWLVVDRDPHDATALSAYVEIAHRPRPRQRH